MRIAVLLLTAAATLTAQNATKPGRFVVEHPTLQNLGFEWTIEGDTNRNAAVEVRFRKQARSSGGQHSLSSALAANAFTAHAKT